MNITLGKIYKIPDPFTGEISEVKVTNILKKKDADNNNYFAVDYEYEDGSGEGTCDYVLFERQIEKCK